MSRPNSRVTKTILNKIIEGEDPVKVSKDLGVGLEQVLLIGNDVPQTKLKKGEPLTQQHQDYIIDCLKYDIPTDKIRETLHIKRYHSDEDRSNTNGVHLTNGSPTELYGPPFPPELKNRLKELDEIKTRGYDGELRVLDELDKYLSEVNIITMFGKICEDNGRIIEYLSSFSNGHTYQMSDSIKVAGRAIKNIADLKAGLSDELLKNLSEKLEEMESNADLLVRRVSLSKK